MASCAAVGYNRRSGAGPPEQDSRNQNVGVALAPLEGMHNDMHYDIALLDLTRFPDANGQYGRRPLSYKILSAYISQYGYSAGVHTGALAALPEVLDLLLTDHSVALFGFYCDYDNQTEVESGIRYVKSRCVAPVIVGGPQCRALSAEFFQRTGCDIVTIGDGEVTLKSLLDHYTKHAHDLQSIPGIVFATPDGQLHSTGEPDTITALDEVPAVYRVRPLTGPTSPPDTLQILTARGCPFHCSYCHEGSVSGVRYRSIPHVVAEIGAALRDNSSIRKLIFEDNTLTLNPTRVEDLCRELELLRETTEFVWACESHVHFLGQHASVVARMVETGLAKLQIGIETGSVAMLQAYRKNITPEQVVDAVGAARDHGLPFLKTNFIIGGPHETWESVEESLALAKVLVDIAPGIVEISSNYLAPYPCTDLAKHPANFGLHILDSESSTCFESMTYPVVETTALRRRDLIRARKYFADELLAHMRTRAASLEYPVIARAFDYYYRYRLNSPWIAVLRENQAIATFFERVYEGGARPASDFCPAALVHLRPVRTIDLEEVDDDGAAILYHGTTLHPSELAFLEYATGKLSASDIWALLESKGIVCSDSGDAGRLQQMIRNFVQRYWLVFVEW